MLVYKEYSFSFRTDNIYSLTILTMEQRGYSPYTYNPFQTSMDLPMSQEPHQYGAHDPVTPKPCRESFDRNAYYPAMAPGWQNHPSPESPFSSTSTLSGSDGFSTPRYIEQQSLPAFNLAEQTLPAPVRTKSATSHPGWEVPMAASNWQDEYQDAPTWSPPQPFIAQSWTGNNNIFSSPFPSDLPSVPSSIIQVMTATYPHTSQSNCQDMQHMGTQPAIEEFSEEDEDDYINDVSESVLCLDLSSWEEAPETSEPSSLRVRRHEEPRMKIHKFPAYKTGKIPREQYRPHVCDLADKKNPAKRCPTRFVRPEHLRRHKFTVHAPQGKAKFMCKVPECGRKFTRGDNLRDHYYTHVERGGRCGKNQKMDLKRMQKILGPSESLLFEKLVRKHQDARKRKFELKL
jgi:hypothetical protein